MGAEWQDLTALGLVAVAVGYLTLRARAALAARAGRGCGSGCGKCATGKAADAMGKPVELIEIQPIHRNGRG